MQPDAAVTGTVPELLLKAKLLAADLDLPIARPGQPYPLLLKYTHQGLELQAAGSSGTVRVDFTDGRASFRRRQQKKEMLVRAAGCKNGCRLHVADMTGGLGRDSFILAAAGCEVLAFEREPIIAALFADGLERARKNPETADITKRITLTQGDALDTLAEMIRDGQPIDVVYLDPMFPVRRKSALVKKELQLLQRLARTSNPDQLLGTALAFAAQRVVVKRPLKALPLTQRVPSHVLTGKTIRFDVYMIQAKNTG